MVLRAGDTINEFGWDNKHAGINVLISKVRNPKPTIYFITTIYYYFVVCTYQIVVLFLCFILLVFVYGESLETLSKSLRV